MGAMSAEPDHEPRTVSELLLAGIGWATMSVEAIEEIADDTLGTLIDSFAAAMKQARIEGRETLSDDLRQLRLMRNLLCHASWRPGKEPGQWHPTFINTRGERFPDEMDPAAVLAIHADTLRAARRVVSIMRGTGIDGEWAGHDPGA